MDLKILTILVGLLLVGQLVNAQVSNSTCIDNNTLQTSVYLIKYKDGVRTNYTFVDIQLCEFGCDSAKNECVIPGMTTTLYMFYAIISFILFFVVFTNILGLKKEPRMLLSVFCTIFFAFMALNSFNIQTQSQSTNLALVILNFGFMAISIIYTLLEMFGWIPMGSEE